MKTLIYQTRFERVGLACEIRFAENQFEDGTRHGPFLFRPVPVTWHPQKPTLEQSPLIAADFMAFKEKVVQDVCDRVNYSIADVFHYPGREPELILFAPHKVPIHVEHCCGVGPIFEVLKVAMAVHQAIDALVGSAEVE